MNTYNKNNLNYIVSLFKLSFTCNDFIFDNMIQIYNTIQLNLSINNRYNYTPYRNIIYDMIKYKLFSRLYEKL